MKLLYSLEYNAPLVIGLKVRGHESGRYGVCRRVIFRRACSGCWDLLEAAKLGQHETKGIRKLWRVILKRQQSILCYGAVSFGGRVSVQFAAEWGVMFHA